MAAEPRRLDPEPHPHLRVTDDGMRRVLLAIRQAAYHVTTEIETVLNLDRPCKTCDAERRRGNRPATR